ncbi:hypothetical protein BLNAU_13796 [Blattamonas nauphoetae]|uniref:Uncharacterized protein n=1 Tax=Blattamonas nauphoetae TaxID=2049346 RepID=A0ABQ9XKF1_9EUKA|nr:hypothetical protein BLNAU_13796 [Blattamonas nauphoetae]
MSKKSGNDVEIEVPRDLRLDGSADLRVDFFRSESRLTPTTAYFGKHNSDSHAGLERGEGRGRDKGGVREVGKEVEGEKGGGRVTTEGGREEANDCVPTDDNDTLFAVFAPPTKSETLRIHNRRSSMNVEERHDEEELR